MIDTDTAVIHIAVILLALFEDLENKVAADSWVVGVAKVLVDALLESFDAFADFLGIV